MCKKEVFTKITNACYTKHPSFLFPHLFNVFQTPKKLVQNLLQGGKMEQ